LVKASDAAFPVRDAELVDQCRRGEHAAFARLILKYQDRVFNTCWRMVANRSDAEDLTQETFVRAFQGLAGFDGRSELYTWLYRIAVNLVISHLRKSGRAVVRSLDGSGRGRADEDDDRPGWQPADRSSPPETRMAASERDRQVQSALLALDDEHRTVVILRDIESLDYAQIAEILEVPVGTVKSRLHRGRMALREKLAPILK